MYARLQTGNTQGMRGVGCCDGGLGGVTGAQAYDAAKAAETNLDPRDYQQNQYFSDALVGPLIESGAMPGGWTNPGGACSGTQQPQLNLFQTASGLALGTTSAGVGIASAASLIPTAAIPVVGAVIAGVAAIVSLVGQIFAHHAAAVKQEDQIYCAALPAAANTFNLILQAVKDGTQTPQQGIDALNALLSKFESVIAPSYGHSPYCNALCEQKIMLDAYVRYWVAQFQGMPSDVAAASTGGTASSPAAPGAVAAVPGAPMSTGEKIAIGAAAALALFFVLS